MVKERLSKNIQKRRSVDLFIFHLYPSTFQLSAIRRFLCFHSLLKVNHLQPNIPNEITIYIYPFQTIYDSFITWEKVRGNKRCYLHSAVSNKLNLSPQSLNNTEKVHFHLK